MTRMSDSDRGSDGKADAVSCKDNYCAGLDKRDLARLLEDSLLLGESDCPALKKVTRQSSNMCAQVDSVAGKVSIMKLHLNCTFLGLETLPCHWREMSRTSCSKCVMKMLIYNSQLNAVVNRLGSSVPCYCQ